MCIFTILLWYHTIPTFCTQKYCTLVVMANENERMRAPETEGKQGEDPPFYRLCDQGEVIQEQLYIFILLISLSSCFSVTLLSSSLTKMNGYSTIPTIEQDVSNGGGGDPHPPFPCKANHGRNVLILAFVVASMLAGGTYVAFVRSEKKPARTISTTPSTMSSSSSSIASTASRAATNTVPWGVNLASWLSLEDYFFVGNMGAVEVATDWGHTAAQCFPPLYPNLAWQSETDLFGHIATNHSVREAVLAFVAYRNSFVDLSTDLAHMAQRGIRSVRVSVSWCLTDADPTTDPDLEKPTNNDADGNDNDNDKDVLLLERYACLDPYYNAEGVTVHWPAVPKPLLVQFLRACHKHGLKAVLDIHTYAGGTSIGTFSGVWPRWSLFWKYDAPELPQKDVGRTVLRNFFAWIESLADTDPDAFAGLGGITPMNEPGHLSGIFGPGSWNPEKPSFVPDLPTDLNDAYLHDELHDSIPDGPHLRILKWQSDAVEAFRQTKLPAAGIDLVVNVHESILVRALTLHDETDVGGRHPQATQLIATWWKQVTTSKERAAWAVLDMHHYHAWEPQCQGTVTGHDGAYKCGDVPAATATLNLCSSWAQTFRDALHEPTARLSSGEFSASTHHSVLESCLDTTTLGLSYTAQMQAAADAAVDLYFWTWKMPHGGAFRPAWSWQELMYRLHGDGAPDESVIPCGV